MIRTRLSRTGNRKVSASYSKASNKPAISGLQDGRMGCRTESTADCGLVSDIWREMGEEAAKTRINYPVPEHPCLPCVAQAIHGSLQGDGE